MNISPLAVVHPNAKIEENVTIDPFAVIEEDVVIGDNCHIFPHAVILDGARLGKNCQVFPGSCGSRNPSRFEIQRRNNHSGNRRQHHVA